MKVICVAVCEYILDAFFFVHVVFVVVVVDVFVVEVVDAINVVFFVADVVVLCFCYCLHLILLKPW